MSADQLWWGDSDMTTKTWRRSRRRKLWLASPTIWRKGTWRYDPWCRRQSSHVIVYVKECMSKEACSVRGAMHSSALAYIFHKSSMFLFFKSHCGKGKLIFSILFVPMNWFPTTVVIIFGTRKCFFIVISWGYHIPFWFGILSAVVAKKWEQTWELTTTLCTTISTPNHTLLR